MGARGLVFRHSFIRSIMNVWYDAVLSSANFLEFIQKINSTEAPLKIYEN